MTFRERLDESFERVGEEIKMVRTEIPSILVLDVGEAVPPGTPVDTIIVRR